MHCKYHFQFVCPAEGRVRELKLRVQESGLHEKAVTYGHHGDGHRAAKSVRRKKCRTMNNSMLLRIVRLEGHGDVKGFGSSGA